MIEWNLGWEKPPYKIGLKEDEVHVWSVGLEQSEAMRKRLAASLSEDERERADKFYFEHHRHEYEVARGALRFILASYLACKPDGVQFVYSPNGKPSLADRHESEIGIGIRFNLSHSGKIALYGVTMGREIGIDIEAVRKLDDLEGLARSNFSAGENAILKSLPEMLKHEAFFNCWTRKEAYIKALGDGLSYPLDQFDVTLRPGEAARLVRVVDQSDEVARWKLEALKPAEGYIAAVIAEGQDWVLRQWDGSGIVGA